MNKEEVDPLKDKEDKKIPGTFKYPLPAGMDEHHLPLQLKQRRETVVKQVGIAIDQAEELGEGLIQALGTFLLDSNFSVKRGDEIAISPEIVVVLLGLAAGHVAATDQSADAVATNPDFARSIDMAYRKNLFAMFRVGYEATLRKTQRLEQASLKVEEKTAKGKRGKVVQFPLNRTSPSCL